MRFLEYIRHVKPNYKPDWYHSLIIETLERAVREGLSVLCAAPPGSGKTEVFSILFPSWLISEDPATHVISLANSDGLSRMAAGNILRIVQSPAFQELCPLELDKATEQQFLVRGNDGRPTLHSAGISGQLTGHRARHLIFDDLLKSMSEAYSETVRERVWSNFSSAAETRLLPNGQIYGIHTRWHMADPIGKLIERAESSPDARQFVFVSLAAVNSGTQSFVSDTRTRTTEYLPAYKSLATVPKMPYSFSSRQLAGKKADLGPISWSALYQQAPVAADAQMFPPSCWEIVDHVDLDDVQMIVSPWDTASKTAATNDPSCNVPIARMADGGFLVLDCVEYKLTMDRLLPVVLERYRRLGAQFGKQPILVVEDASSGTALLDLIKTQFPDVPILGAKAVKSKIIRAESVTPFTTAHSVRLLKGPWNEQFITDMSNFPVSPRDHGPDAFAHGMRVFTGTGSDFLKPQFTPVVEEPLMLDQGYRRDGLNEGFEAEDGPAFGINDQYGGYVSPATQRALNRRGGNDGW
jgi:predicted phage terminase large subunit-like protein